VIDISPLICDILLISIIVICNNEYNSFIINILLQIHQSNRSDTQVLMWSETTVVANTDVVGDNGGR